MTTESDSLNTLELAVRVWGMNAEGRPFFQNATARNLANESATLNGIEHSLKVAEVIGVQHADKKARVKVVRITESGVPGKIHADVEMLDGQLCPWGQFVTRRVTATVAAPANSGKRRFPRFKVQFPLELRDQAGGAAMQTAAADSSGRGCYVESRVPLPVGTNLNITFWIGEEKLNTTGVIRASDPGVGMGIEFIGLDDDGKERLQSHLEKLADEIAQKTST